VISEELHPETKHGVDRKSDQVANLATRFTASTAEATGKPGLSIQRAAVRAEALGDDFGAVTGTSLDKGVELDSLASSRTQI
jgi:ParB family transcriptional regulator, chromosome partitioning protein